MITNLNRIYAQQQIAIDRLDMLTISIAPAATFPMAAEAMRQDPPWSTYFNRLVESLGRQGGRRSTTGLLTSRLREVMVSVTQGEPVRDAA
ncbi:hypothetical protein X744_20950 [Mesorhizobium sp. LNJC372A00]|nr:hypothetical protein X745_24030 [Mesorhizobium sp. LNJC374B00]ESY56832.1 hypothetical protein X744_20950 [Mesorhizobium sp. LNJC372A00]